MASILSWDQFSHPLRDAHDRPLWLEHPQHGHRVDAVALPLALRNDIVYDPYEIPLPEDERVDLQVAGPLSIVGFPFGLVAAARIAVWVQGTIATEPEAHYMGLPCMLIDSRTRPGQSGSPVVFHSTGGVVQTTHGTDQSTTMRIGGGHRTELIGVYSGRVNESSDLGFVWRADAIAEIIYGGRRGED